MPGRRRASVHRIGRGLLRQRHVRELLRDPRMRTARSPEVPVSCRSPDGRLRVHRGLVQSTTAPLRHRISVTRQLRKEPATTRSPKSITVHETGATPRLASATATSLRGLRASIRASQGSVVLPRRTAPLTTAMASGLSRPSTRWAKVAGSDSCHVRTGLMRTSVPSHQISSATGYCPCPATSTARSTSLPMARPRHAYSPKTQLRTGPTSRCTKSEPR